MKSFNQSIYTIFLCSFMVIGFTNSSAAQAKSDKGMEQTVSFKVTGICGQCKERIESVALDVKGVKKAEWDIQTDMLVLVGSSKMDKQKVASALAKAGHKSELAAADQKGYAKLPGCCQYDSGIEKH
ncbi:MAG: heavy-metal-associated domain-containing protein [Saprospiraceae bacterium]|nr:heavy-metal-associated domain-containing protein [Saprospiraceae bacterium]